MFDPGQFQINEAWIVFKLNDAPVITEVDGDFNVLALMDAATSRPLVNSDFIDSLYQICSKNLSIATSDSAS